MNKMSASQIQAMPAPEHSQSNRKESLLQMAAKIQMGFDEGKLIKPDPLRYSKQEEKPVKKVDPFEQALKDSLSTINNSSVSA